jgi:putative tryptophan/tyrosine transport system substrate-binding protein
VITRRDVLILLGVGSFTAPIIARAIDPTYPVHIGLLRFGDRASAADYLDALKRGLRDLGYIEGKNLALELRYADGEVERLRGFAAELVKLKVSIIVTTDTPATLAAQRATTTIPIVFATAVDPVGSGLVRSLAHPGGNVTGLSNITNDITPKHVELLAAVVPRISALALLANPANPSHQSISKSVAGACEQAGVKGIVLEADAPEKIDRAFAEMNKRGVGAIIVALDPFFGQRIRQIAELALKYRLPSVSANPVWASQSEVALLMGYGQNIADNWRRAATYCDKILRGAKPGNLPVEQSTSLVFVINQQTAKTLGIVIPQAILMRADKLIE